MTIRKLTEDEQRLQTASLEAISRGKRLNLRDPKALAQVFARVVELAALDYRLDQYHRDLDEIRALDERCSENLLSLIGCARWHYEQVDAVIEAYKTALWSLWKYDGRALDGSEDER